MGSVVSWISCFANNTRRVCATATGRRTQMLQKEPAHLTFAYAKAIGQSFHTAVTVQRTFTNQYESA